MLISAWAYGFYPVLAAVGPLAGFSRTVWSGLVLIAALVGLTVLDALFTRMVLPFALPVRPEDWGRLGDLYRAFRWGWHGPAYFVTNGQRVETYSPHQRGWSVVVCDNTSAVLTPTLQQPGVRVHGPGVHLFTQGETPLLEVDLRPRLVVLSARLEKGVLQGLTVAQTADGHRIAGDLFVVCALEDFRELPPGLSKNLPSQDILEAEAFQVWKEVYAFHKGVTLEQIRAEGRAFSPFYGHPLSIQRAYALLSEEERQQGPSMPWWKLAEGVVLEAWSQVVSRYTLEYLFPPGMPGQRPSGREAMEREWQQRLLFPLYYDPSRKKPVPSREYRRLQERGLRVLRAWVHALLLEPHGEEYLIRMHRNPLLRIAERLQEELMRLRQHLRENTRHQVSWDACSHVFYYLRMEDELHQLWSRENALSEFLELQDPRHLIAALETVVKGVLELGQEAHIDEEIYEVQQLQQLRDWLFYIRQLLQK